MNKAPLIVRMIMMASIGVIAASPLSSPAASKRSATETAVKGAKPGAGAVVNGPAGPFVEPEGVYKYGFDLPNREPGYWVAARSYLDDLDPAAKPTFPSDPPAILLSAARGEYEPATFTIYATRSLENVEIEPGELRNDGAVIPAQEIEVRRVVRCSMRRIYTAPIGDTGIVGRFLPLWRTAAIRVGEFREAWLTVHVPSDAKPGDYAGSVIIRANGREQSLPLNLRVHSFDLKEHPDKSLGMYYSPPRDAQAEARIRRELKDMYAHGARNLKLGGSIGYQPAGKTFEPDYNDMRRLLAIIRECDFRGTMVFGTGFENLARRLGLTDVLKRRELEQIKDKKALPAGESLEGPEGAEFRRVAKKSMEGVLALQKEFPDIRLVVSHMDEVFNSGQLPIYIRLSKAARQVPEVKLYITISTRDAEQDKMRREIDPYVDIRCNNGASFERWLAAGHTMDEYRAELAASGDEAWFYHNVRGPYFTAKWARIINGFYLWASPFRVHCPWIYQSYHNNPFDDGDDAGTDFGFSFPDPQDESQLVSTRIWECMREGGDDLRYVATLESAIEKQKAAKPKEAAEAQAFLDQLRGMITHAKLAKPGAEQVAREPKPGDQIDLDTGVVMGVGKTGTAEEAPVIHALAQRFTGAQWQGLRERMVEFIAQLRENQP